MKTPIELVEYLRKLCKENGTSLTKIEELFGWANGTIGKWSKNKKLPSHDRLKAIADHFDKTVAEIIGEEGEVMEPVPPEQSTRCMTQEEREAHYRGLHLAGQKETPTGQEADGLTKEDIDLLLQIKSAPESKKKAILELLKGWDEK